MDLNKKNTEKQETSYLHQLDVEVFYFNENGIFKPSAYQALFANLAERHLDMYKHSAEETMKYGLAWALISITIQIDRPVKNITNLWANTWYSQKKGPYYRRELVFYNEDKEIMFRGSTFSVLLDVNERRVYRKKELPFQIMEPHLEFSTEAAHRFKKDINFTPHEDRRIYGSDLDLLGHVNNRRYGDFAYDALTKKEQEKLGNLNRLEFYFVSEMRENDDLSLLKSSSENEIFIRGENKTKGDRSFDIVFSFG